VLLKPCVTAAVRKLAILVIVPPGGRGRAVRRSDDSGPDINNHGPRRVGCEALAVDLIRPDYNNKSRLTRPAWACDRSAQPRGFLQNDSVNSVPRERQHDYEHLRDDGKCGCSECDEVPGNDLCNYCATREAGKYANYVRVLLAESL
jgi:hypothetical protein